MTDVSRETPPVPAGAPGVFSDRLPLAERYAEMLATEATVRGLIGPREVPRLWERHLLNCAVVADLLAPGISVGDIGSGAGLPGLVLAIRRPDLTVTLVEPLLRRTTFLEEAVARLELTNVEVCRGRAEEMRGKREFDVVTSRAVAPLDRLADWSLPLTRSGGEVVAMKGSSAADEIPGAVATLRRRGAVDWEVVTVGQDVVETPVTVVRIHKGVMKSGTTKSARSKSARAKSTSAKSPGAKSAARTGKKKGGRG